MIDDMYNIYGIQILRYFFFIWHFVFTLLSPLINVLGHSLGKNKIAQILLLT